MSEIIRDTDPPRLDDEDEDEDEDEIDPSLLESTEGFDSEPVDTDEEWEGRHQPPVDIDKVDR